MSLPRGGFVPFLGRPKQSVLNKSLPTLPSPSTTGSGSLVYSSSPVITNPTIYGTTTNDNAASGVVGELLSSTVPLSSAVSLTTATDANVTSMTLTPGDWDVSVMLYYAGNAATTISRLQSSISFTSAVLDTSFNGAGSYNEIPVVPGTAYFATCQLSNTIGPFRVSVASNTPTYLVAKAQFLVNTCTAYGILRARRIR